MLRLKESIPKELKELKYLDFKKSEGHADLLKKINKIQEETNKHYTDEVSQRGYLCFKELQTKLEKMLHTHAFDSLENINEAFLSLATSLEEKTEELKIHKTHAEYFSNLYFLLNYYRLLTFDIFIETALKNQPKAVNEKEALLLQINLLQKKVTEFNKTYGMTFEKDLEMKLPFVTLYQPEDFISLIRIEKKLESPDHFPALKKLALSAAALNDELTRLTSEAKAKKDAYKKKIDTGKRGASGPLSARRA